TGNDLQLSWTTSREINNSGFEIERTMMKGSPAEAGQWSKINFVSGHGNSNTLQNYSYEDKNLSSGKYNYRLKQIDYNGNFQFFNLNNEVIIGIPDKFEMSQNYPNPFNPTTKINYEIPDEGIVTLKIFDNNGREVMSILNELKSAGYYTAEVNLGGLSSGTYFYRIESGKFVNTKKMILLK
ncbi:MAG: T9SS type A sorting domain-containing protein, partial [bacterium]